MFGSIVTITDDRGAGFSFKDELGVGFDDPVAEVLLEVASQGGRIRLEKQIQVFEFGPFLGGRLLRQLTKLFSELA